MDAPCLPFRIYINMTDLIQLYVAVILLLNFESHLLLPYPGSDQLILWTLYGPLVGHFPPLCEGKTLGDVKLFSYFDI